MPYVFSSLSLTEGVKNYVSICRARLIQRDGDFPFAAGTRIYKDPWDTWVGSWCTVIVVLVYLAECD